MKKLFRRLFCDYKWYCAFRKSNSPDQKFHVLNMPKNYWAADPFLFEKDGKLLMFFEYTNEKKGKSVIAAKEIYPEEKENVVVYEFEGHTSYPCIFCFKDKIYMIPETSYSKSVVLLECMEWPYRWAKKAVLISDILAVDTTVFNDKGSLKLFVYSFVSENKGQRKLYLCDLDVENATVGRLTLLKTYPNIDGRPGGACFNDGANNYRVVQPGYNFYGEKLDFYVFNFDGKKYDEKLAYSITASDVAIDKRIKFTGVHTYNRFGSFEVIDLRGEYRFNFKVFRRVFSLLKLFGFRNLEKET